MSALHRYAAVNARVRTLLPTLLGRAGLAALYSHPSEQALGAALERTAYMTGDAERGSPEHLLPGRLVDVGRKLLRLLEDPERALLHQYLLRSEIENLKLVIRAVHGQRPWQAVAPLIIPLPGIATIDPESLARSPDLRELGQRLRGSAYGAALRGALHRVADVGPFAVEIAVELDFYERLWAATAALAPADARDARELLGMLFDILNLTWIARYRDGLGLAPEEILNYTVREGRWITLEVRRRLAESPGDRWEAALARTPYARLLGTAAGRFDAAAVGLWRLLAGAVQRAFAGHPFRLAVPLGLLLAQEIELRDVGILLAAKRAGLPAAEAFDRIGTVRP